MKRIVLAVLLFGAPALAQRQAVQEIDMSGEVDIINGTTEGPDITTITARKRPSHPNLIRVRETFKEKVLASDAQL